MISQETLKNLLNYNPETGIFVWKQWNSRRLQKEFHKAGIKIANGYINIRIDNKSYAAHRLAWLYVYGKWPENYIDHINNIRDDNRILNLREASHQENNYNSLISKRNSSGFKGVYFHKKTKKWIAACRVNGKVNHLGSYDDAKKANEVVINFRTKHHGIFSNNG